MTTLYAYGTVGYDIDADWMRIALDDSSGHIDLRINSGGGDVFEGNAMYSLLESYKAREGNSIDVYVDGIAASIASVIAMAGDNVYMSANALMMVHNPWTPAAAGGSNDLRDMASVLDKIRDTIVTVYEAKTGMDRETLGAMMDEETWFSATEAVTYGFADKLVEASEEPVACIKAYNYVNAPEWLRMIEVQDATGDGPERYTKRNLAKAKLAVNRCCNKSSRSKNK